MLILTNLIDAARLWRRAHCKTWHRVGLGLHAVYFALVAILGAGLYCWAAGLLALIVFADAVLRDG